MYRHPVITVVRELRTITLSASENTIRQHLGRIEFSDGALRYIAGGADGDTSKARAFVAGFIKSHRDELLQKIASTYDPTLRADGEALARIEAARREAHGRARVRA